MKDNSGFTLIELIIVIAILAVISAIAIPNIIFAVDNARIATDVSNAKNISDAIQISLTKDNGIHRIDMSNVEFQKISTYTGPDAVEIKALIEDAAKNIQSVPVIKYGTLSGTNFTVSIGSSTGIVVYAGLTKIYPNPEGDWAN